MIMCYTNPRTHSLTHPKPYDYSAAPPPRQVNQVPLYVRNKHGYSHCVSIYAAAQMYRQSCTYNSRFEGRFQLTTKNLSPVNVSKEWMTLCKHTDNWHFYNQTQTWSHYSTEAIFISTRKVQDKQIKT